MGLSRYQQAKLDAAYARADREAALRKQNGRCAYCLDILTYKNATRDHMKPRSAGGMDGRNNIKAACYACNQTKGAIPYKVFMRMITHPVRGEHLKFRLIWSSRRINKRLIEFEKTLMRAVGIRK